MSFSAQQIKDETNQSMNAMLLLNSSCQGLIEASIQKVDSPWYAILSGELKAAEELVIHWRNNGFLYFKSNILNTMTSTGQQFLDNQTTIDTIYKTLSVNYSQTLKDELVQQLTDLASPISGIIQQMDAYTVQLTNFGSNMQIIHNNMQKSINDIQAQESKIQNEINEINTKIDNLKKQIQADREAIAKVKQERENGIIETIFGVIFAPFTFGASLILAGIGVATIAEAEDKINDMESSIAGYQQSIASDQVNLSEDQKEVATLNSVLLGTALAIDDMNFITEALQVLKISWATLSSELSDIISKTQKAENSNDVIVGKAWFDSACLEWAIIIPHSENLSQRTIQTTRVTIGN